MRTPDLFKSIQSVESVFIYSDSRHCERSEAATIQPFNLPSALKIRSMAAPQLLNAYQTGDLVGPVLAYTFILLMTIELIYVFVKYVVTSNK